ncbi:MAG: hypothetical protein ND866_11565, partial [Pyrinomonadaceae bacterium]|nr:hypothetical protein [Pyrinomonadaceae bacterium]
MNIRAKTFALGTFLFAALVVADSNIYGQSPTPSPSPASGESAADKSKSEAEAAAQAAKPAATPEADFWKREQMTGDWGGDRSRWKEGGVDLEFKLTQFYQGVASGGISEGSEYNGKFEYTMKLDL